MLKAAPENDFVGVLDPKAPNPEPLGADAKGEEVVEAPKADGAFAANPPKADTALAAGGEALAPKDVEEPNVGLDALVGGVLEPKAAGLEDEKPANALGAAEGVVVAEEPKAALVPKVGLDPNAGAPNADEVEEPNVELPNPELPNADPPKEGIEVEPNAGLAAEVAGAEVGAKGLG